MNRQDRGAWLDVQVETAIQDLEARIANGHTDEFLKALKKWSKLKGYSFNNTLLILWQKPDAIQMAGFKAWEKMGFHVKQGETGCWVRGPVIKKTVDEDTGEVERRLAGYIPLCVFCVSQTAEWPDKYPPEIFTPADDADWENLYTCWSRRLMSVHDITVKEMYMGKTYGMATSKTIRISSRLGYADKAVTLIHELCHIVANHPTAEGREKWTRQEQEAQSEAATFVLCSMLGKEHQGAVDYLINYRVQPGQLAEHLETIGKLVREVRFLLDFKDLCKVADHEQAA